MHLEATNDLGCGDIKCPYCRKDLVVVEPDGGYTEDYNTYCPSCNKPFLFVANTIYTATATRGAHLEANS